MTTIRKIAFAALLAAATFTIAPTSASAQQPARGRFTLTHDVLFGNTRIPVGDYEFSYDPQNTAPFLNLSKMSGPRAGSSSWFQVRKALPRGTEVGWYWRLLPLAAMSLPWNCRTVT